MIILNPTAKIISVSRSDIGNSDTCIKLCFNTAYSIISHKSILDLIFMLNGLFNTNDIYVKNTGHTDIDTRSIVKEFLQHSIVVEDQHDKVSTDIFKYTVHFPTISNVNTVIAVLLQKLNVKSIFYHDSIVDQKDVYENLYYKRDDIGKSVSTIMKNIMNLKTISFATSIFDEKHMINDKDIIVNSNCTDWIDSDQCAVINTWNYKNVQFENFEIFSNMLDISDDLNVLIQDYSMAIRAIFDMIYSVKCIYV